MPVTITGGTITPDPSRQTGSLVGCATDAGPACELDGWLGTFITRPLQMRLDGDALQLSSGGVRIDLRRDTGSAARIEVNGRTLLTYPATGEGGAAALLRGVLAENPAGCIAVGDTVLIVPSSTGLLPDGSLVIGAERLRRGDTVRLGGGTTGIIPDGSPCHETGDRYFTVAAYPQPQDH